MKKVFRKYVFCNRRFQQLEVVPVQKVHVGLSLQINFLQSLKQADLRLWLDFLRPTPPSLWRDNFRGLGFLCLFIDVGRLARGIPVCGNRDNHNWTYVLRSYVGCDTRNEEQKFLCFYTKLILTKEI